MSSTPLYYPKQLVGPTARQQFVPLWVFLSALAFLDIVLVVSAFTLSDSALSFLHSDGGTASFGAIWFGWIAGVATVFLFGANGLYARQLKVYNPLSALDYPKSFLIAVAFAGCLSFMAWPVFATSPNTLLLSVGVGLFVAWPLRSIFVGSFRSRIRAGKLATSRAIVLYDPIHVGEKATGVDILAALGKGGIDVVYAQPLGALEGGGSEGLRTLRQACANVLREQRPDAVYVALDGADQSILRGLREALGPLPIPVYLIPGHDLLLSEAGTSNFAPDHIFELQRTPLNKIEILQKRIFDIVLSALMLLLLSPLILLVAVAIKLDSPGPVFFRQTRRGLGGRNFRILKFRTMTVLEDGLNIQQAGREDIRVTRLGKSLRQSSIDELPQLLNVLLGHMSLVGPRPHAIAHDDYYGSVIACYVDRQLMRPGLTGWAQVCGHRGATPRLEDMAARIEHDKWYINNWSFWLDIRIVIKTGFIVFKDVNAY